jgi:hypothetical protein
MNINFSIFERSPAHESEGATTNEIKMCVKSSCGAERVAQICRYDGANI